MEWLHRAGFPGAHKVEPTPGDDYDIWVPEAQRRLEVKFDVMSRVTGNFAIEVGHGVSKPTGISTSTADYFVYGDGEYAWFFKRGPLWEYCMKNGVLKWGGDGKRFMIWVVPREELEEALQPRKIELKVGVL